MKSVLMNQLLALITVELMSNDRRNSFPVLPPAVTAV